MNEERLNFSKVLKKPTLLKALSIEQQNIVLRMLRQVGLLGYVAKNIPLNNARSTVLFDILQGASIYTDYHVNMLDWEVNRLNHVFSDFPEKVILLKGAAYRVMKLDFSKGRFASDVDILVSKDSLALAEERLLKMGWEYMEKTDYEDYYYRQWMHELPPMRHKERGTIIDLHHNILPETSRYHLDSDMLIAAAVPSLNTKLYTLSPEDTVLHKSVHLFVEGDLKYGMKEVIDLNMLFKQFSQAPGFWENLLTRSVQLKLQRPLYYALYFCRSFFQLDVPVYIWRSVCEYAPRIPFRFFILSVMNQTLIPNNPDYPSLNTKISSFFMYTRSHWLRMPLLLLIKHLLKQIRSRGGIKAG